MDRVTGVTRSMAVWHAPLLFLAAFLPYPTAIIGQKVDNPVAIALFAGTEAALLGSEAMLKWAALRAGVVDEPDVIRRGVVISMALATFFLITAVLGFAFPDGIAWAWPFAPLVVMVTNRVLNRLNR